MKFQLKSCLSLPNNQWLFKQMSLKLSHKQSRTSLWSMKKWLPQLLKSSLQEKMKQRSKENLKSLNNQKLLKLHKLTKKLNSLSQKANQLQPNQLSQLSQDKK